MKKNKKGQIGETVTWFVAILIVIGIIIIFLVLADLLSVTKRVTIGDVKTDLGETSIQLQMKTTIAEQIEGNFNNQKVSEILKEQNG